uniref:Secreted protein n=1 Tax=Triticum urartu TaxID=4572 RepID=A0A8R7Q7Q7_TRIUA
MPPSLLVALSIVTVITLSKPHSVKHLTKFFPMSSPLCPFTKKKPMIFLWRLQDSSIKLAVTVIYPSSC